MTTRSALLAAALALSACGSPPDRPRRPSPPAAPPDPTPAIVLRGEPRPRPEPAPARGPDPALIEALRREAARPAAPPEPPEPPAPPPAGQLPVVLGDTQGFGLLVDARADGEGGFVASVELQNRGAHAWAAVVVAIDLLEGRRHLERATVRLERVERRGSASAHVEGALPPGADRVRAAVVEAEPRPGEADVAWRARRLRGFDVRAVRLLRTRAHELDAILELADGPLPHVPWSGADVQVTFLDDRGDAITRGRARLVRGQGPPWRLHVVGAETSRRQVALVELDVEDVRFD